MRIPLLNLIIDGDFQISGSTMTGTLTMGPEKKLY
jgi:hypothetical protein